MQGVCGTCGGPTYPLGQLGRRMHERCRNCGADQSFDTAPEVSGRDSATWSDYYEADRTGHEPEQLEAHADNVQTVRKS